MRPQYHYKQQNDSKFGFLLEAQYSAAGYSGRNQWQVFIGFAWRSQFSWGTTSLPGRLSKFDGAEQVLIELMEMQLPRVLFFFLGVGKVVSMDPFPSSPSHCMTWGAQTWGAGRGLVLHSTAGPCGELRSWSCAREMGMGSQGFSVPSLPDKSPPCSGLFLGVIFWVISCSCTICLNLQMKQYLKEIGAVSIHLNRV